MLTARKLSKFRLPCLWEIPFSCILLLRNYMISLAISFNGALENFRRLQILLAARAREIFGLWKIYSIFNTKFQLKSCSTNMCCYLQVLPCHSWLGARFHIRHISFVSCNTSIIRPIESICFPDFFQKSKCTRANTLQDDFQDPNLT